MTEQEKKQQKEIERLQKKIRELSAHYSEATQELEQLKKTKTRKERGRPGVDMEKKAQVPELYAQGKTMRQVAEEVGLALGTVYKIIQEAEKNSRVTYIYMDRETPSTIIDVYGATRKIDILNLTDDMLNRAFGVRERPTWETYEDFLEDRCMPRTRYGIDKELAHMGLDTYDPFLIIEITKGRVYGDSQWLKRLTQTEMEAYDNVLKETKNLQERRRRLITMFTQNEGDWL